MKENSPRSGLPNLPHRTARDKISIATRAPEGDFLLFTVFVRDSEDNAPQPVKLKAICHPGDEGEPVITVLMPDED